MCETERNTFLDSLYEFILKTEKVSNENIFEFIQYLRDNEYDSNAVFEDLEDLNDSNIYNDIYQSLIIIDLIKKHKKFIQCMFGNIYPFVFCK